ncbi:hypothetical protein GCM10025859_07610 [Alicyclobacillus fastidiosus]|nr:hypothetical protein GCM10025859_07610 [Alicyclobacillus fastidiosus]
MIRTVDRTTETIMPNKITISGTNMNFSSRNWKSVLEIVNEAEIVPTINSIATRVK